MRKRKSILEQKNSYWLVRLENKESAPFEVKTISWEMQTKTRPPYWNKHRVSLTDGLPSVFLYEQGECFLCSSEDEAVKVKDAYFVSNKLKQVINAKWHTMDLNILKQAYENLKDI